MSNIEYFKGYLYSFLLRDNEIAATSESNIELNVLLDLHTRYSKELENLHNEYFDHNTKIETSYTEIKEEMNSWKNEIQEEFTSYIKDKQQILTSLESTYKEHLRLEGPATYWNKLSMEYNKKGNTWRLWALISTIIFESNS